MRRVLYTKKNLPDPNPVCSPFPISPTNQVSTFSKTAKGAFSISEKPKTFTKESNSISPQIQCGSRIWSARHTRSSISRLRRSLRHFFSKTTSSNSISHPTTTCSKETIVTASSKSPTRTSRRCFSPVKKRTTERPTSVPKDTPAR